MWGNLSSLEFLVGCKSLREMRLTRDETEQLGVCSTLFSQDLWKILRPAIRRGLLAILSTKFQVNLSFCFLKVKLCIIFFGTKWDYKKTRRQRNIQTKKPNERKTKHWWDFCQPERESLNKFVPLPALTYLLAKITSNLLNSKWFH